MNIVFRVDASIQMGIGHLMRCLTLAKNLQKHGIEVGFICREHSGNCLEALQHSQMSVTFLPAPQLPIREKINEDYSQWLGVSQSEDAVQTIAALNDEKPDWLVVDHYGLDREWESKMRPHVGKIMVIDDLANRGHDCDVLLDQNYFGRLKQRYTDLLPASCFSLLGPRYALISSEYSLSRKTRDGKKKGPGRVVIFFGGTDPDDMTGLALEALSSHELQDLTVDVVIGVNNPHSEDIEIQASGRRQTFVHRQLPSLASLMAKADLAIGAAGTTTWERMCLGLPALIISVAENQRSGAEALARDGFIRYLGNVSEVGRQDIIEGVVKMMSDKKTLVDLSERNQTFVDGLGARRITEVISPTESNRFWLREAEREDVFIYFNWANDSEVRRNSFHEAPISWDRHKKWFCERLGSSHSRLYVLHADELPVGQIRFDPKGSDMQIDYSLDEIVRGRGLGTKLVSLGIKMIQDLKPLKLLAEVRIENQASRSVFSRLGFAESKITNDYSIFEFEVV